MEEEINIELDDHMSNYYNDRLEYMKTLQTPTLTVANDTLKTNLAHIVFNQCDNALKINFGLEPPLQGHTGDMWNSPSDLLQGKVALVPPLTRTYIQALTHQGILKIGREIEQKFLYEQELEKQNALAQQKKQLTDAFQDLLKEEIKDVEARERAACHREMERMNVEFEATLIKELDNLEKRLQEEYAVIIQNRDKIIEEKWKNIMQKETEKTIKTMTADFLNRLELQEELLKKEFTLVLRKAEVKRQYDLGIKEALNQIKLNQLRHELECKNIANMMYIICMERRKCLAEKIAVENQYLEDVKTLNTNLKEKEQKIQNMHKNINERQKEIELRETCILEIIKQFQKFINFALKSAPTQAEFLLSVEKMMVFELTDSILKSKIKMPEPCERNLPWLNPKQYVVEAPSSLELEDFHKCFHEILPQKSNELLPAFYYKDKLYIREDFRDMLTHGITISPSNELWNEDVEILMESLKKIVQPVNETKHSLSISDGVKNKYNKKILRMSALQTPNKSTETQSFASAFGIPRDTILKRSSLNLSDKINYSELLESDKNCRILGAKNSLDITISKMSIRNGQASELQGLLAGVKETIKEDDKENITQYVEKNATVVSEEYLEENVEDVKKIVDDIITETVDYVRKKNAKSKEATEHEKSTAPTELPLQEVVDFKDSLILRKSRLATAGSQDFDITPKDSIELAIELKEKLKPGGSKFTHAKCSVELLRESLSVLKRPMPTCNKYNEKDKIKEKGSSFSKASRDVCCLKCYRQKSSVEVIDGLYGKKEKTGLSGTKALQVSKIEIIKIEQPKQRTSVVVDTEPKIFSKNQEINIEDISRLYKPKKKIVKAKPKPTKLPAAKIVGDPDAKEHLQDVQEFTTERIQSLVSLMKDYPNLIRMFTPGTR